MTPKKPQTKKITVILSLEEHAALVKKAAKERRSIASFIRWIALVAMMLGCSGENFVGTDQGEGGDGPSRPMMGAAELQLSKPRADIPNIGSHTSCSAGTSGTYTYFLGNSVAGETAEERIIGAMRPNARGFQVECSVVATDNELFVSASISGTDSNSRHVAGTSLAFAGSINAPADFGALDSAEVNNGDTGPLSADPFVSSCVLSEINLGDAGSFWGRLTCPVALGNAETAGCSVAGIVSFRGCSG